jgi:hypothetical protein
MSRADLRHLIYVMEGALVRAVQFGAQQVNREIRGLSPDIFTIAGDADARGVYLDGFGVFFDVGVPILRQSVMWGFRTLQQDEQVTRELIAYLRKQVQAERDPGQRRTLDLMIRNLELQLPTPGSRVVSGDTLGGATVAGLSAQPVAEPSATAPRPPDNKVLQDPNRAYTDLVQRALIDAMLDYSMPMLLGENEWLTVAARDNEPRDIFAPQDPAQEIVTFIYRIKGSDLAAYRAGRIDREEAKRRVEIKEF